MVNERGTNPGANMAGEIGNTILAQLGGLDRLSAMLGIRHVTLLENGVGIRFAPRAVDSINHLQITLEPSDLYRVEFWHCPRRACDGAPWQVATFVGVPVEQLKRSIEERTGLRLSL